LNEDPANTIPGTGLCIIGLQLLHQRGFKTISQKLIKLAARLKVDKHANEYGADNANEKKSKGEFESK
jgi:hypothetical protein